MNAHDFLKALSIVMAVAAVTTVVFQRLKQPVVLGYILAGLIVGPHVPIPLVADAGVVQTLSELGVILLMFALGLEFSLKKLVEVGPTAGLTAVIQTSLMTWVGYLVGQGLGWSDTESLFIGVALAVSSTTIIAKAFEDLKVSGRLKDLVVGILIVEDLISVLAMAALTAISREGAFSAGTLVRAGGQLAMFLVVLLVAGLWVVPRAMRAVTALKVNETTLVASVGICFVSALAAMEAGYSVALGAFLAGSLIAESGHGKPVEHLLLPVRDMFAAVFFVSVGMLLDPRLVAQHWQAVLLFTAVVIAGKVLSVSLGGFLTGNGVRTSVQAGMSLAQIGEFSFIIVALGLSLKATGPQLYPIVVAVSVLTTLTTPWMIRFSGPVAETVDRKLPKRLQTFAALYGHWTERLAESPDRAALGAKAWGLVKLLMLDAAVILLVAVVGVAFEAELAIILEGIGGWGPPAGRLLLLALAAALTAPFFVAIVRVTRALGNLLAEAVFPVAAADVLDLAAAPRRAMVAALQWVAILIVGLPLLALTQPLLHSWQAGAVLGLGLAVLAVGLWRHASDLQGHVQAGSELLAESLRQKLMKHEAPAVDSPAQLPELLSGLGDPVSISLPMGCHGLGRSLAELKLRGVTGATVLALIRADGSVKLATADLRLEGGDTLVLAGSRAAVDAARDLLKA